MIDVLKLKIVSLRKAISAQDRDNILNNLKKVRGRLRASDAFKSEPIAIVGYGPSLKTTWELLKDYKVIMTTSGAHNFLIERGVIPTYHVDCDPRAHKAKFTQEPHVGVQYLIGSSAHPSIVDQLLNHDIRLWNFDVRPEVDLPPEEEQEATFGDVGQQAIHIAAKLGYTKYRLFGFDYSFDEFGQHAGEHGNENPSQKQVQCGNKVFTTNDEFIKTLLQFDLLVQENPDLDIQIHGDGLLSHFLEAKYA